MKKCALIVTLVLTLFLLTACQPTPTTIAPAKMSENEQKMFSLLGPHAAMFDLNMQKNVRSIHVNLYTLEGGQWQPLTSGGRPFSEQQERIVLSINEDAGKLILSSGGNTVSFKQDGLGLTGSSVMTAMLSDKTTLHWDEEVPVFLYVESDADTVSASIGSFYRPEELAEHERVYALTVMVSQQDVK